MQVKKIITALAFLATAAAYELTADERLLITMTNGFRFDTIAMINRYVRGADSKCGVVSGRNALYFTPELTNTARSHNEDMSKSGRSCFQHETCGTGEAAGSRIRRVAGINYSGTAENIAFRSTDSNDVMELIRQWIESEGHCKNMQKSEINIMGAAISRRNGLTHGTQNFAYGTSPNTKIVSAVYYNNKGVIVAAVTSGEEVQAIVNGRAMPMKTAIGSDAGRLVEVSVDGSGCNKYFISIGGETYPQTGSYQFGSCNGWSNSRDGAAVAPSTAPPSPSSARKEENPPEEDIEEPNPPPPAPSPNPPVSDSPEPDSTPEKDNGLTIQSAGVFIYNDDDTGPLANYTVLAQNMASSTSEFGPQNANP